MHNKNGTYDSTGRLTGATDTAAGSFGLLGYSYDPNGNRQSETRNASTLPYVYSPPNWLHQKGSDTRSKTASGNTASSTAIGSFGYDGFNRLATSQTAAETTTYTYNALGQRIKKINQNGLSTVFHYGPDGELLYERDQAGNTRVYVWFDGRPLARIDNDAQIYYYHVDHLGTPQAMTNSAGATVWKADYEPFGKATVKVSTIENNLRLPGQYYDRETGLHYNYFRDYDPGTGRYIEADPIGLEGGLNLYAYGGGNPLSYIDSTGEVAFVPILIWGAQAAWGAYQGYQAAQAFNTAQCNNPPLNGDMNDGEGPTPGQNAAQNVKTFSNGASAYGGGAAKALAGVAVAGVTTKFGNPLSAGLGFAAGAYFGSQQPCACPAQ